MSPIGTSRTWRDVRLESAVRSKPDIDSHCRPTTIDDLSGEGGDIPAASHLVL
jgi:hypothetical protein